MLEALKLLMKGKVIMYFVAASCLFVMCLAFAGILPWNSTAAKAAEQIFETETGVQVITPNDKAK